MNNKIQLIDELNYLTNDKQNNLGNNNFIVKLTLDPLKYFSKINDEEYEDDKYDYDEENEISPEEGE